MSTLAPGVRFTVFLDRDGVFNQHSNGQFIRSWRDFHFLPGVPVAFARLNRPDVQTCLITNQQWFRVAFGSKARLARLHERLQEELAAAGGRLDHVEAATVVPWRNDRRRKPNPGMLKDAAAAFANADSPVYKDSAIMVGDKLKDAQAAASFGIPCILVATSTPAAELEQAARDQSIPFVAVVAGLPEAVALILGRLENAQG